MWTPADFRRSVPVHNTLISGDGQPANPASSEGSVFAWDANGTNGDPGRQIFVSRGGTVTAVTHDPTGTSINPTVDKSGARLAFESAGDLSGTGGAGTPQVFLLTQGAGAPGGSGSIVQVSRGTGTSRNAVLSPTGLSLVFDSTSDPTTGLDTGGSQIWFAQLSRGTIQSVTASPITSGYGSSRHAGVASGDRLVVFDSTTNLAGAGEDTGVSQVFAYYAPLKTYAQITRDANGCHDPTIHHFRGCSFCTNGSGGHAHDWRMAFMCGQKVDIYDLQTDQRYEIPFAGGDTASVMYFDFQFVLISTTLDLFQVPITGGTAPVMSDHQAYLWNLFKRPPKPVPGKAIWFPVPPPNPL